MRKRARVLQTCGNIYQRCWFAYPREVGTSAPACVRCGKPNPNYDPNRDTRAASNTAAH